MVTSTILGQPYPFGMEYARFDVDDDAVQRVVDLISQARTAQYYGLDKRYEGVDFHGIGHIAYIPSSLRRTLSLKTTAVFEW